MTDTAVDLIERLEKTTEGSRELDAAIALATSPVLVDALPDPEKGAGHWIHPTWGKTYALDYTTSIDAALTLVPEGCDWILSRITMLAHMQIGFTAVIEGLGGRGEPDDPYRMEGKSEAVGPTPAMALCIAALRARLPDRSE